MVDETNPASSDPANEDTLVGAFNSFERDLRLRLHNMLPAQVVSYDRATNRVTVQPMIQLLDTSNNSHNRSEQSSIPVHLDGGGGFVISYSLVQGDLGWIKANDRDISLFLQSYDIAPPNDFRLQDYSSAVFVPDVMTGYTIDPSDDEAMVIQSLDGTIKISLSQDKIRIQHPTLIESEAPDWNHVGKLHVTGDIDSDATITAAVDVVADDISVKTHLHDGSPTAPAGPKSNTGLPLP